MFPLNRWALLAFLPVLVTQALLAAEPGDLAVDQATLAVKYERLEALALRIAELAEGDDPERAEQLRGVIRRSREMAVADRFATIVDLLESERLTAANTDQQALAEQLGTLMRLLLADPREAKAEAERKRLKALLKDVKRFIKQQQALRDALFDGDEEKRIATDQAELADRVDQARRRAEGDPTTGDAKPDGRTPKENQSAPGKKPSASGQTPNNAGDGQSGDGQSGDGQSGDGQQAEPSQSDKQSDSESPPPGEPSSKQRAQKRLADARRAMQQAVEQLQQEKGGDAQTRQAEAQQQLEDARREIEQALLQLREEEQMRMLTRLATRFRRMLAEQTEIYELTKSTAAAAPEPIDRSTRLAAAGLSEREQALGRLADGALRLLREDGKSIAFPETVEQIRDDMQQTTAWLGEAKLGPVVQRLEEDILEQLQSAIAAFEQAAAEKQQQLEQPPGEGQQGPPGTPQLVDLLAELRMVRSLQARLLRRTAMWDQMLAEGSAPVADARLALQKLARDQQRLAEAAESLGRSVEKQLGGR